MKEVIKRIRECEKCQHRVTTYEIEKSMLLPMSRLYAAVTKALDK